MSFIDIFEKSLTNGNRGAPATRSRTDRLQAIEAEIVREQAEALGRAGERLEEALNELESVRQAIALMEVRLRDSRACPEEGSSLQKAHSNLAGRLAVLHNRARLAHEYLLIQREAVGVRNHQDVERCYRISERVR